MNQETSILSKLWNFELTKITSVHKILVVLLIFFGGTVYVIGEVLFGLNPLAGNFTAMDYLDSYQAMSFSGNGLAGLFPHIWIGLALVCVIIRVTVIIHSYIKSKKVLGEEGFDRYLLTYFSSFLIAAFLSLALLFSLVGIASIFGIKPVSGFNLLRNAVLWIEQMANTHVPTLINVKWYGVALVLTIFLSALPGYLIHLWSHRSRFAWYVFHRCHHCPQFLHPMGAPPAFAFDFVLILPSGIIAIAISKLIYTEPLVMEMGLWLTFGYCFEIFNHSIVHYDFAYKNFFVRNMSRLIGDRGVYHLMHHSAKPNDQTINLGASPFLFWDRLFGTYREPYREAPPVGLTKQPKMRMNPIRIILSGIAQLWFELKENKGWKTRFRILFGPIHYMPPKTKEYLILSY